MNKNSVVSVESIATAWLAAMDQKNLSALEDMMADDMVMEMPFNESGRIDPGCFRHLSGKEAITAFLQETFDVVTSIEVFDLDITAAADGKTVFIEGKGCSQTITGQVCKNRYVFRFDVSNGKVTRFREYYNPVTLALAFGRKIAEQVVLTQQV